MKVRGLLLLALSVIFWGSGCATIKGYPDRSGSLSTELGTLSRYFDPTIIEQYEHAPNKKIFRDEVVYGRIRAIDLHFAKFQQDLVREDFMGRVASRWTVLGLTGAIATGPGASASAILGGISAGITGASETIEEKTFIKATIPVLLAKMVSLRKEVLVEIMKGLREEVEVYPLNQALMDVEKYYQAGTITGALIGIAETAGADAKMAEGAIKELTLTPLPQKQRDQKRALGDAIEALMKKMPSLSDPDKSEYLKKINAALKKLNAPEGKDLHEALKNLRDRLRSTHSDPKDIAMMTEVFKTEGIFTLAGTPAP
jgi:hypothetical protein